MDRRKPTESCQGKGAVRPRPAATETSLRELHEMTGRMTVAAERERRRIERDLHDGAQQRLVALRVTIARAREIVGSDPAGAGELLRRLDGEVEETLQELRHLAHGLCPPVLADLGLREALRSAGRIGPLPVRVSARGLRRYPPAVEGAVYFAVLEALQNAAKHAAGATGVTITLVDDGDLRFAVTDDGAGFRASRIVTGDGLLNMRDRLVACGGTLEVRSRPGEGTRVSGTIPAGALTGEGAGYEHEAGVGPSSIVR